MYKPKNLQNSSQWAGTPTICISVGDEDWEQAYQNWVSGKNPTDNPEWKKGVYLTYEEDNNG